eukprot:276788_1
MAQQEEKKVDVPCTEENFKLFNEMGRKLDYKHQAMFFLNAMWTEYKDEAEKVYSYVQTAGELDKQRQSEGYCMDEFEAHRFLEKFGQPLTVVAMRKELKKIDLDSDKHMSLLEYFVYHYKLDIDTLMTRPQGVNEQVEKAEAALEEVFKEIAKIEKKKKKLLKKVEKYGDGVKGKMAKNELAQLEASDPMPLRKALITAQAAIRSAQKSKNLNAMGKLWYMEKEMAEAQKYKPKANWKRAMPPTSPISPE